jgi:ribonuclease HI
MELHLYCDGACEDKNPGGHGVGGWVLKAKTGYVIKKGADDLGRDPTMTNNIAEYGAVRAGVMYVVFNLKKCTSLVIYSDSRLVINQLKDEWKCNHPTLRKLRDQIWNMLEPFGDNVKFVWIPREENTEADAMSRSLY